MLLIILLCTFVSLARGTTYINSFAGPFDFVVHYFEKCPGPLENSHVFDMNPMRLIRDRHNKYIWWYNGTVSITEDVTDQIHAKVNYASWSSRGGWVENAYRLHADHLCSLAKRLLPKEYIRNVTASVGITENDFTCPLPKGTFTVRNLAIDTDVSHLMPPLPYGKWRIDLALSKNKNSPSIACLRGYVDTKPKPGGKSGKLPADVTSIGFA